MLIFIFAYSVFRATKQQTYYKMKNNDHQVLTALNVFLNAISILLFTNTYFEENRSICGCMICVLTETCKGCEAWMQQAKE